MTNVCGAEWVGQKSGKVYATCESPSGHSGLCYTDRTRTSYDPRFRAPELQCDCGKTHRR